MTGKHRKPEPEKEAEPIIGRPPKRFTEQPQSQPIGNTDDSKRGRPLKGR